MTSLDRQTGHLVLAAVRVLAHLHQRSPRIEDLAELLELPAATLRLYAVKLQEIDALTLVESAYETHLEIRDYRRVEDLEDVQDETLAADLADFDRRKQAEAEKMARLFEDGTFAQKQQDKLARMDEGLPDRPAKPRNPFGDD